MIKLLFQTVYPLWLGKFSMQMSKMIHVLYVLLYASLEILI